MNFITEKSTLQKALSLTKKAINDRTILPIMGSFLFQIDGDRIAITGGNMEMFMTTSIDVKGSGFTKNIAIPADRLTSLLSDLPDQPLTFTLTIEKQEKSVKMDIVITSGYGEYKIPVESGDDYPQMDIGEELMFEVPSNSLINGIDKTLFACSNDPLLLKFNGVHMFFDHRGMNYSGCDGSVLSFHTSFLEEKVNSLKGFTVPTKVLSVLQSVDCAPIIKGCVSNKHIQFIVNEDTVLKSLLVDAIYPDTQSVIPIANDKHILFNRVELTGALKRVSQFSHYGLVKVVVDAGELKIISDNDLGEYAEETIKTDYTGEHLIIGLNGKQIINCLSKVGREEVQLSFSTPQRGVIITGEIKDYKDKTNLMVVMPYGLIDKSA